MRIHRPTRSYVVCAFARGGGDGVVSTQVLLHFPVMSTAACSQMSLESYYACSMRLLACACSALLRHCRILHGETALTPFKCTLPACNEYMHGLCSRASLIGHGPPRNVCTSCISPLVMTGTQRCITATHWMPTW